MNPQTTEKNTNGIAIGSFMIGIISIFGLIFIQEGTALSIAGLILGVFSLKETQARLVSRKLGLIGIAFNLIGFIGFITLMV